jgi:hypothetical protein
MDGLITTVNPGAFGVWWFVKYIDEPTLALSSLGALVQNVVE